MFIQKVRSDEMYILISDKTISTWYALVNKMDPNQEAEIVESCELHGGPQQPFEYAVIKVSKKSLAACASPLVESGAIVAGLNRVRIKAAGSCENLIVTKCKLSGDTYTITAYCEAERYRGLKLLSSYAGHAPADIIRDILSTNGYGVTFTTKNIPEIGDTNKLYFCGINAVGQGTMYFSAGNNVWQVLQLCAYALGCVMYFAGDNAYVVNSRFYNDADAKMRTYDTVVLNSELGTFNVDVCGEITLGDEGIDTVMNIQTIYYGSNNESYTCRDADSVRTYGGREGTAIYMPTAQTSATDNHYWPLCIAQTMIELRSEPQQSVTFTVKETKRETETDTFTCWAPLFNTYLCRLRGLQDARDDVNLNNLDCLGNVCPQKLLVSEYCRNYPDGTSTYTVGQMANVDLAQSTSEILTAQGSR